MVTSKQGTIRKTYTIHLKLAILKEVREGMMTQVDVAEKCGISTSTISDWCKKENQDKYFDMAS
jgi:transposase-like protein